MGMSRDPVKNRKTQCVPSRRGAWLRFIVGLVALALFFLFFASGYSLPGIFGEVLRHNQANAIDASPLLYMEVEHMADLEAGVKKMREEAGHQTEPDRPGTQVPNDGNPKGV